jgi:hypothetical protein
MPSQYSARFRRNANQTIAKLRNDGPAHTGVFDCRDAEAAAGAPLRECRLRGVTHRARRAGRRFSVDPTIPSSRNGVLSLRYYHPTGSPPYSMAFFSLPTKMNHYVFGRAITLHAVYGDVS